MPPLNQFYTSSFDVVLFYMSVQPNKMNRYFIVPPSFILKTETYLESMPPQARQHVCNPERLNKVSESKIELHLKLKFKLIITVKRKVVSLKNCGDYYTFYILYIQNTGYRLTHTHLQTTYIYWASNLAYIHI